MATEIERRTHIPSQTTAEIHRREAQFQVGVDPAFVVVAPWAGIVRDDADCDGAAIVMIGCRRSGTCRAHQHAKYRQVNAAAMRAAA